MLEEQKKVTLLHGGDSCRCDQDETQKTEGVPVLSGAEITHALDIQEYQVACEFPPNPASASGMSSWFHYILLHHVQDDMWIGLNSSKEFEFLDLGKLKHVYLSRDSRFPPAMQGKIYAHAPINSPTLEGFKAMAKAWSMPHVPFPVDSRGSAWFFNDANRADFRWRVPEIYSVTIDRICEDRGTILKNQKIVPVVYLAIAEVEYWKRAPRIQQREIPPYTGPQGSQCEHPLQAGMTKVLTVPELRPPEAKRIARTVPAPPPLPHGP